MRRKRKGKGNVLFLVESIVIIFLMVIIFNLVTKIKEQTSIIEEETISISTEENISENDMEEKGSEQSLLENQTEDKELTNEDVSNVETNHNLEIVVFGDSIWDDKRGNNGVSEYVQNLTGGIVYNCAVGGTTASVNYGSTDIRNGWDNKSLNSMTYIANGTVSGNSNLQGLDAGTIIQSVDFTKVDYLIFSYGLNDYFSKIKVYPEDMYDMSTYVGALRHATIKMKEAYPNLKIIIISPTYCKVFEGKNIVGDSDSYDYGEGNLEKYVEGAKSVADEYGTYFIDAYHNFDINAQTADQYLEDGIHLSEEGSKVYGEKIAEFINEDYRN